MVTTTQNMYIDEYIWKAFYYYYFCIQSCLIFLKVMVFWVVTPYRNAASIFKLQGQADNAGIREKQLGWLYRNGATNVANQNNTKGTGLAIWLQSIYWNFTIYWMVNLKLFLKHLNAHEYKV
jgi:hypothetical protein